MKGGNKGAVWDFKDSFVSVARESIRIAGHHHGQTEKHRPQRENETLAFPYGSIKGTAFDSPYSPWSRKAAIWATNISSSHTPRTIETKLQEKLLQQYSTDENENHKKTGQLDRID